MLQVKIASDDQIALPSEFCKVLGLKVGDYVNAELDNNRIVLTLQVSDKKEAKGRFFELVAQIRENTKDISQTELDALVSEAAQAAKTEHEQIEGCD